MKDTAISLSCESESSCRAQISLKLEAIVPVDAVSVFEARAAEFLDFVKGPICQNFTFCQGSLMMRDKLDKWARVPNSGLLAIKRRDEYQVHLEELLSENATCNEFDEGCDSVLSFALFQGTAANRR